MDKNFFNRPWLIFLAGVAIIAVIISFSGRKLNEKPKPDAGNNSPAVKINRFNNQAELADYWSRGSAPVYGGLAGFAMADRMSELAPETRSFAQDTTSKSSVAPSPGNDFSLTNVQVAGIDEPDMVKTDGINIYLSGQQRWYGGVEPFIDWEVAPAPNVKSAPSSSSSDKMFAPAPNQPNTDVIQAVPAEALKKLGKIERQGELLLSGKTLIVLGSDHLWGYDISTPEKPREIWSKQLRNNTIITSRLFDNKIYLVLRDNNTSTPVCPYEPLSGDNLSKIACRDIYRPSTQLSQPVLYTALTIDPQNGQTDQSIGFAAEGSSSIVYMSPSALYITYAYSEDQVSLFAEFINQSGASLFSEETVAKINRLSRYDLSAAAKQIELQQILEKSFSGTDPDERLKRQTELSNRLGQFIKNRSRSLVNTGIVKIPLNRFQVQSSGSAPGTPLNQFALDEYQGNLRIATTVDNTNIGWLYGWGSGASEIESSSSVYVLNPKLNIIGSVRELGKTERIYAVRFIEDQAYLVTFRQTDPLYVLDLSNPASPQKRGELKIPGYSSYLHPLGNHQLFGLGMDNGQVKLSLFDVSNPANPVEKSSYKLNEYYSEAGNDHHAFYVDSETGTIFIPTGANGYILSYKNQSISLVKALDNIQARRALRINNNLYLIGESGVTVLERNSWKELNKLSF